MFAGSDGSAAGAMLVTIQQSVFPVDDDVDLGRICVRSSSGGRIYDRSHESTAGVATDIHGLCER